MTYLLPAYLLVGLLFAVFAICSRWARDGWTLTLCAYVGLVLCWPVVLVGESVAYLADRLRSAR